VLDSTACPYPFLRNFEMNNYLFQTHRKHQWIWMALALITCLTTIALLPSFSKVRFGNHLNRCYQNHREITKGILAYEQDHGHLPPPYLIGDTPDSLHSWRVLILPYIGHQNLYEEYRFDEPWNGPNNVRLASQMPDIYRCPDDRASSDEYKTSYVAVTGPNTMWPTDHRIKSTEIVDRPKDTALLLEFTNHREHWMSPVDLAFSDIFNETDGCKTKPSSNHEDNAFVVSYAQGYTEVIEDVSCDVLRAMLTTNGNENIDWRRGVVVQRKIERRTVSPENPSEKNNRESD